MNLGAYLKQLRHEHGFTLNEVAGKLDMSSSFLSQIENMKISPSLDSLEKLCNLYSVNLSDFFRQVEQRKFIIVKKEETQTFELSDGALKMTLLASKLQNNSLETYLVEFRKKAVFETAILPRDINGERIIYINSGKVILAIDNEAPLELNKGDSINYKSYIPCSVSSEAEGITELIISGMPPLLLHTKIKPDR